MMMMDPFKALILGILVWFLLFAVSTAVSAIVGESMVGIYLMLLSPVVIVPVAWFYLRDEDLPDRMKEGFYMGIIWIVISIILDAVIMAFLFGKGFQYFIKWTLWFGYIEMLIVLLILAYVLTRLQKRWLRA